MNYKYVKTLLAGLPVLLLALAISCRSRVTIISGKIVDQHQQPVDSILVSAIGSCYLHAEYIEKTLTDKNGQYRIMIDVPDEYYALNIFIPGQPENPKYQALYKTAAIFKNRRKTSKCCDAEIGKSTQWDFELAPK